MVEITEDGYETIRKLIEGSAGIPWKYLELQTEEGAVIIRTEIDAPGAFATWQFREDFGQVLVVKLVVYGNSEGMPALPITAAKSVLKATDSDVADELAVELLEPPIPFQYPGDKLTLFHRVHVPFETFVRTLIAYSDALIANTEFGIARSSIKTVTAHTNSILAMVDSIGSWTDVKVVAAHTNKINADTDTSWEPHSPEAPPPEVYAFTYITPIVAGTVVDADINCSVWFEYRKVGESTWETTTVQNRYITVDVWREFEEVLATLSPLTEYEARAIIEYGETTYRSATGQFVTE